jgi:hypothetical protein
MAVSPVAGLARPTFTGPTAASTIRKLKWAYGVERLTRIVLGEDEGTNADLASWRRVGAKRPAAS